MEVLSRVKDGIEEESELKRAEEEESMLEKMHDSIVMESFVEIEKGMFENNTG
jgi:hypothetical protein